MTFEFGKDGKPVNIEVIGNGVSSDLIDFKIAEWHGELKRFEKDGIIYEATNATVLVPHPELLKSTICSSKLWNEQKLECMK